MNLIQNERKKKKDKLLKKIFRKENYPDFRTPHKLKDHISQFIQLGFGAPYATLNILKNLYDQQFFDNFIKSQKYVSEDFEGEVSISSKPIYDEYFGDTMTFGLDFEIPSFFEGSSLTIPTQPGIYAPAQSDTGKHLYTGDVVLVPAFVPKTDSELNYGAIAETFTETTKSDVLDPEFEHFFTADVFDTTYHNVKLDYGLQSRNYMGAYSDFYYYGPDGKEVKLSNFYAANLGAQAIAYEMYKDNSILALEDNVAIASDSRSDNDQNKVLPYTYQYYPVMTFVDATSEFIQTPQFYEECPLIIPEDAYQTVASRYESVFKIWDGKHRRIQITPENGAHIPQASLTSIAVYSYDMPYREIYVIEHDDFKFDHDKGDLTLDDSAYSELSDTLNAHGKPLIQGGEPHLILELRFKKYGSVSDSGSDYSSEELRTMALMQSIQANVLEYYYQFQVATQTQQKLDQIAYTVAITLVSTALTLPISAAGQSIVATSLGTQGAGVSTSIMLTEPLEEVYVDPLVESTVTGVARDLGLGKSEQIILAGLAESGRESLSGFGKGINQYQQYRQQKAMGRLIDAAARKHSTHVLVNTLAARSKFRHEAVADQSMDKQQYKAEVRDAAKNLVMNQFSTLMFKGDSAAQDLGKTSETASTELTELGLPAYDAFFDSQQSVMWDGLKPQEQAHIIGSHLFKNFLKNRVKMSEDQKPVASIALWEFTAEHLPARYQYSLDPKLAATYYLAELGYNVE
ncbi:MAG: hypothetical protein GF353_17630, partial [Candidatus Lokiarchaeota archaeon]|nr:hypothetical protein [Candidatus Lokiarchaeota archaeon]